MSANETPSTVDPTCEPAIRELSDDELKAVVGGFNPVPEPPGAQKPGASQGMPPGSRSAGGAGRRI